MAYQTTNPHICSLTAWGAAACLNAGYTTTSTSINQQSSSAWNYLTTCVVMTAGTTVGTCSLSLDSGFLGSVSYLVGLMTQANSSNLYSDWNRFYSQIKTSLLNVYGEYATRVRHATYPAREGACDAETIATPYLHIDDTCTHTHTHT